MTQKITRAVFPVAGMGTRMLPATKAIPKELLPMYDTPILDVLVEEAIDAGIEEIIFIVSREKYLIEHYFDSFPELERKLIEKNDTERLARIQKFKKVHFSSVRQGEQKGDGHAIMEARHLLKDDPFLVVFGDDVMFGNPSSMQQLLQAYETHHNTIIGVYEVEKENVSSYGIVCPTQKDHNEIFSINDVQEKPTQEEAKSNLAIIGKYICTKEIWNALENAGTSHGGEIRLADAFLELLPSHPISACRLKGNRFDTGNMQGYFYAYLFYALKKGEIKKEEIIDFCKNFNYTA